MHKPLFPIVIALALAACGGSESSAGDAPAPADAAQPAATTANPMLHLSVTGETGTFMRGSIMDGTGVRVPACMTALVVENRSDKPLMLFSADFTPTHAQTGEALEVVLSLRAGVPHLSPDKPLAPGERGQPWKMNVVGASCEQVQYTLGPINCSVLSGVCAGVSAEQTGLAGISPVSVAAARR
jgi:hypothetical protein